MKSVAMRVGPYFNVACDSYKKYKVAYSHGIRRWQVGETEEYTNDIHEALTKKRGNLYWKCWNSKLGKN